MGLCVYQLVDTLKLTEATFEMRLQYKMHCRPEGILVKVSEKWEPLIDHTWLQNQLRFRISTCHQVKPGSIPGPQNNFEQALSAAHPRPRRTCLKSGAVATLTPQIDYNSVASLRSIEMSILRHTISHLQLLNGAFMNPLACSYYLIALSPGVHF